MEADTARDWQRPARWLFVLGLFAGLAQLLFPVGFGFGAGWEPVAIARELASSGDFANPFQAGPSGPTAMIPPLFPLFLAALLRLLGDTPAFALVATLLCVVALASHAALLPAVSVRFLGHVRPGIFAGLLSSFSFQLMPQWDVMFTCSALLLFLLRARFTSLPGGCLTGLSAGLLLLANPAVLLLIAPWGLYHYLQPRRHFLPFAAAATTAFLVLLPWMVRNSIALGSFSLKNNLGFTLYVSNADCVQATLAQGPASDCLSARNPNKSAAELALLNQLGETRYDAVRKADALHWILTHRGAFVRLTLVRFVAFWFPPQGKPPYTTFTLWLVTALSLPGLVLIVRRRLATWTYLLGVSILYPILYYLVVIDIRYRYPILWISLLGAGYVLHELSFLGPWKTNNPRDRLDASIVQKEIA